MFSRFQSVKRMSYFKLSMFHNSDFDYLYGVFRGLKSLFAFSKAKK
jgi:hypothetical protein